ncbi:hypothetical protein N657DRAFT_304085 [Parathielavia appendiculata]|uniref:Uncharacterized protein n=1 Tax=Parathielavia appendiculata TaxID=2587402 RepID=A0AAN6Z5E0_9PEZI|nr:hypothetical protein N657DRAFT_304085 [Parathielavia appendiculata]
MRRRLSDADMGQDCDASLVSSQGWSLRRGRQLAAIARDIIEDNMYIGHGLTCLRMSHLCQHQRQSDNQGSQQSPQTLQCLLITSLINVQAAPLTTLPTSTSGPTSPFTPPPPPQSTTILNSKCPRTSTTNRCPPTANNDAGLGRRLSGLRLVPLQPHHPAQGQAPLFDFQGKGRQGAGGQEGCFEEPNPDWDLKKPPPQFLNAEYRGGVAWYGPLVIP